MEELQGQHAVLRDCIEQLTAVESSRTSLVSHLREALQEQVGWPMARLLDGFILLHEILRLVENEADMVFFIRNSSWIKSVTNFRYVNCIIPTWLEFQLALWIIFLILFDNL